MINSIKANVIGEHRLTSLAPRDDATEEGRNQAYFKCLNSALRSPNIFNIALTGHYGSGKSTILQTYQKLYGQGHSFLNISLATFTGDHSNLNDNNAQNNDDEPASDNLNHLVEHSILQQIFYQVPKKSIPRSRFKRITQPGKVLPWLFLMCWLLCVACASMLFDPKAFDNLMVIRDFLKSQTHFVNTCMGLASTLVIILPAFFAFSYIRTITLRKLNVNNCEIEIADQKEPSALNQHLDEILYFFEATRFDIVVLEDLDRFKRTEIFTKLREINTLINRNIEAKTGLWARFRSRKRVVFIYAVKDDMFERDERTKFFDLIIPIIPVVNHVNSREIINRQLADLSLTGVSKQLINDISLYVSDMRLLLNTVNEYSVYSVQLNMAGLVPDKLFSMLLYKNLFPSDFNHLQMRKGLLYACLTSKRQYQEKRCEKLRLRISAKQDFLNAARKSSLVSLRELRQLYVYQIMLKCQERTNQIFEVRILNRDVPHDALTEDEAFDALRKCTSNINLQHGYTLGVGFPAIEKCIDAKRSYDERAKLILAQDEAEQSVGSREISAWEIECAEASNAKLKDVIEADCIHLDLPANEDQKGLLLLLLKRGYIDETYQSYLSYFYEGTLSNSDWVYVMSVKKGDRLDPDYKLGNISDIIDQNLSEAEVVEQATQNIFILNHLLKQNSQLLGSVYDRLSRKETESVKFLTLFVKTEGLCQPELIQTAHVHWYSLWDAISQSKELSVSDINLHLSALIRYVTADILQQIVIASDLTEYISGRADFIRFAESIGDEALVVRFLEEVEPVFLELSHFPSASTGSKFVYEKGMYEMNTRNVSLMFSSYISNSTSKDDPTLTEILAAKTSPLRNRVESELNTFVSNVLLKEDIKEREHEDTVVWLLNNSRLKHDLKLELASGKCKPLHTLADIDPDAEIYAKLLSANAICPSWENVFVYLETFCENELDDTLAAYLQLERTAHELRRQKIDDAYVQSDTENAPNIVHAIFACRKLGRDTVNLLIESVPTDYVVEDLSTVCKEYVPIIISRRHVVYSTTNYNYVKAQCRESLGAFSRETFTDLLKDIANIEVQGADLRDMLAAQKKPRDRLSLANSVLNKGPLKNLEAVADELCKMREQDGSFMESTDHSIFSEVLVEASDITMKLRLLTRNMQILTDSQITAVLESVGEPYCGITKRGLSPSLPRPEITEGLAFQLEKRGYISSFTKKDGVVRIYTFQNDRRSELAT